MHIGLQDAAALDFVRAAGAELIASYAWQRASLDAQRLSDARNVRDLLSTVGAGRIAAQVGISREVTWEGLRAFVPSVLRRAEGQRPASRLRSMSGTEMPWRRARRAPASAFGFMQPME